MTLVFFITFFNAYQGVREVNRAVLNNDADPRRRPRPAAAPCLPADGGELDPVLAAHLGRFSRWSGRSSASISAPPPGWAI